MMRELWRTTGQLTELPRQSTTSYAWQVSDDLDEVTFDFKIFYTDDTPEESVETAGLLCQTDIVAINHRLSKTTIPKFS